MGLQIILDIHQQDDIAFDDIAALNDDLMNDQYGGFSELYGDFVGEPGFEGPFKLDNSGKLKIAENWDGEFSGYGRSDHNSTMVWGCYGKNVWQIIAGHLTGGKLVFHIEIEGNPDEFAIITPGSFVVKSMSDVRF
jgi:hypothetical protein